MPEDTSGNSTTITVGGTSNPAPPERPQTKEIAAALAQELKPKLEALVADRVPVEIENQATAMAERILPQLSADIQTKMDARVDAMRKEVVADILAAGGRIGPPDQEETGPRPYDSFGAQLQAIVRAAREPHAVDAGLQQIQAATTGLSEGVGSEGGFLVQQDYLSSLLRNVHETGQVVNRIPDSRMITISSNANGLRLPAVDETSRADGSRWGGTRGYWLAEGATITASQPAFRRIELELAKLAVLTYATSEQLEDTSVLEGVIRASFEEEFGFMLDDALINGDGTLGGIPQGVLNAAALISVSAESGQAATTIVFENIVNMWARLWARSRTNAVWFISQDIEPQLYQMSMAVGTGGVPVYMPAGGISGQPFGTLFGRPVVPIEQCATLGTVGDIILADMGQYWAIRKGGPRYAASMHVQFLTDEMAFRGTYRFDARPQWRSALTPYNGGNTVSPFVALATRS